MSNASRLGDLDIGSHIIVSSTSPDVFVNGMSCAIVGSIYSNSQPAITGSSTVFVNGSPIHRVGDLVADGHICVTGSDNVNVG